MNKKIKYSNWEIIEENFNPENTEKYESLFSLGNGKMGHRGNFEEFYSGKTLQGSYIGGIYYPDKTKVGWWKNGYPKYFAKIINSPEWRNIKIKIAKNRLDLYKCKLTGFKRILNMKHGYLYKKYVAHLPEGKKIAIESIRFLSIVNDELGAIKYSFTPLNFSDKADILIDIDADVTNRDANYSEKFWKEIDKSFVPYPYILTETKKTFFNVCTSINYTFEKDNKKFRPQKFSSYEQKKYLGYKYSFNLEKNKKYTICKYAAVTTSLYYKKGNLLEPAFKHLETAVKKGFDKILQEHKSAWEKKWENSDINIKGDISAQQAVRFNIFNLLQTYTGKYDHLNIGPKGFTGEKYGGLTYWDTEAFCLPFYLSTSEEFVAENLLKYRYKHLPKAIDNGKKLGFNNGAALYPMVTINGEECHNEWEITFEEIHRNGAIAYAIYKYVNYTGKYQYLANYGLEVLIAISRFWKQRINYSENKKKYVLIGVTGPNEYENNINNNWYTSTIAIWTLKYTIDTIKFTKSKYPENYKKIINKTKFNENEIEKWQNIINNMYLPYNKEKNIFLQQEGFLDKELLKVDDIKPKDLPICQNWSWDRILRSCFIKQADVLQGLFFFEKDFNKETIKRNFEFYEPMTVHESSLSPSIHSIIAAIINKKKKAYELFLRSARLDLDDFNKEVHQGLHITSMAGTWMSIIYGFARMQVKNEKISFAPFLPHKWNTYSFKILFRNWKLKIIVKKDELIIKNLSDTEIKLLIYNNQHQILPKDELNLVGI